MAFANSSSSFGGTYRAAPPAETRVSFRSNETMGFPRAIYSITLIQVETSLSGLEGFGSRQMSVEDKYRSISASGMKPVNQTYSSNPNSREKIGRAHV